MTRPRAEQILPGQSGFYHCISRCVRRSWLCGFDSDTGRDYSHRRAWIVERMRTLTTCFAVDIYAYAVMSNHTHIVLFVDPERLEDLCDDEIIKRWTTLWNWRNPSKSLKLPVDVPPEKLSLWRNRLGDVSWFMRMLNEPIARIANAEDGCKGHFWESRFKSLPLLDEGAVLACMTYVDLNPIKAGVSETIEGSDYTSIQLRVRRLLARLNQHDEAVGNIFERESIAIDGPRDHIGVTAMAYIDLVKQTAEKLRDGATTMSHSILRLHGVIGAGWMTSTTAFFLMFRSAAGGPLEFNRYMESTRRIRKTDKSARHRLYSVE